MRPIFAAPKAFRIVSSFLQSEFFTPVPESSDGRSFFEVFKILSDRHVEPLINEDKKTGIIKISLTEIIMIIAQIDDPDLQVELAMAIEAGERDVDRSTWTSSIDSILSKKTHDTAFPLLRSLVELSDYDHACLSRLISYHWPRFCDTVGIFNDLRVLQGVPPGSDMKMFDGQRAILELGLVKVDATEVEIGTWGFGMITADKREPDDRFVRAPGRKKGWETVVSVLKLDKLEIAFVNDGTQVSCQPLDTVKSRSVVWLQYRRFDRKVWPFNDCELEMGPVSMDMSDALVNCMGSAWDIIMSEARGLLETVQLVLSCVLYSKGSDKAREKTDDYDNELIRWCELVINCMEMVHARDKWLRDICVGMLVQTALLTGHSDSRIVSAVTRIAIALLLLLNASFPDTPTGQWIWHFVSIRSPDLNDLCLKASDSSDPPQRTTPNVLRSLSVTGMVRRFMTVFDALRSVLGEWDEKAMKHEVKWKNTA